MKERPILFSAPMVRALLDGSKTQTRRVLKGANAPSTSIDCDERGVAEISTLYGDGPGYDVHEAVTRKTCPYGQPGDRLYVRETWGVGTRPCPINGWNDGIEYRADDYELDEIDLLPLYRVTPPDDVDLDAYQGRWHPSIHMPRWASRINLEITGVRVERLQDISEADANAEGVATWRDGLEQIHVSMMSSAVECYARLWESINGAGTWDANPWVWVIEFKSGISSKS